MRKGQKRNIMLRKKKQVNVEAIRQTVCVAIKDIGLRGGKPKKNKNNNNNKGNGLNGFVSGK